MLVDTVPLSPLPSLAPSLLSSLLPRWLVDYPAAFAALPLPMQYGFTALFALAIGSFLTVVIHRVPLMMERAWREEWQAESDAQQRTEANADSDSDSDADADAPTDTATPLAASPRYNLAVPHSACPQCGYQLRLRDNIPLLSYALSGGRCRACHAPIGRLYPLIEALTLLLGWGVLWLVGPSWHGVAGFGLGATLIALGAIDARTHLLPDAITLPLLWAGLLLNVGGTFTSINDAIFGAVAGYLFLWSIYWAFLLLRGKEGIGYGDFKLLSALGAWFGWQLLPQLIVVSALSGSIVGLVALLAKRLKPDQPLPFGPYLAAAGIITLFCGDVLARF